VRFGIVFEHTPAQRAYDKLGDHLIYWIANSPPDSFQRSVKAIKEEFDRIDRENPDVQELAEVEKKLSALVSCKLHLAPANLQ
jgi:hypothetical protein